MDDGYNRFENDGGGGSFVMGLLTGTVLGAGLGMLFAPKAGSELRNQLSEQAGNLATAATDQYQRATEAASGWAERGREAGREAYDKTKDAITKGADEAQRYVKEATSAAADWSSSSSTPGSSTGASSASSYGGSSYGSGSSSEHTRGSASEQTGGSRSGGSSSTGPSSTTGSGPRRS